MNVKPTDKFIWGLIAVEQRSLHKFRHERWLVIWIDMHSGEIIFHFSIKYSLCMPAFWVFFCSCFSFLWGGQHFPLHPQAPFFPHYLTVRSVSSLIRCPVLNLEHNESGVSILYLQKPMTQLDEMERLGAISTHEEAKSSCYPIVIAPKSYLWNKNLHWFHLLK